MINAEEHKKLLAQVAELERNSVSYFDVEKEFFLIDSDNLAEVKTRLYGYSIQATGIYEEDNLTEEAVAGLDGRGCYVYVEAKDGQITIKQDLNGCWGLYLFRHGDYFALSNSFFRLLDHVKYRYPLTVNRDYCHHLLFNEMVSHACSETAVNEVQFLDRSAIVHIHVEAKNLELEMIDYQESTVSIDSEEGIALLDNWVELWSGILRNLTQHTDFIQTDLSGGFDSRMSLLQILHSGIDLDKIQIYSIQSDNYKEDYAIASQIATHYGFKLNQPLPDNQFLSYSLSDVWNIDAYHRQTIHKVPKVFGNKKSVNKIYTVTGYSGETMRGYWRRLLPEQFIENQSRKNVPYSKQLYRDLSNSMRTILESGFNFVRNKYDITDEFSLLIPQYLYQEARARTHYGKFTLGAYFSNNFHLSPALDPIIRRLKLDSPECFDPKLLMTVLFTRYEPDLLNFPFDSNRSIAPETLAYARKLNERFPICHKKVDNLTGGGASVSFTAAGFASRKASCRGL